MFNLPYPSDPVGFEYAEYFSCSHAYIAALFVHYMTKKLLNIAQVCSVFQQMCSERVPQRMNTALFYNTRSLSGFFKNLLYAALRKMSIKRLSWKQPTNGFILDDVLLHNLPSKIREKSSPILLTFSLPYDNGLTLNIQIAIA